MTKFCRKNNIINLPSAPYHPQSNGKAELFVETFKRAIKILKEKRATEKILETFLLAYRPTPSTATPRRRSPAEIF